MLPSIAIERHLTEYRFESQLDMTSPHDDVLYLVWILGLRLEPENGRELRCGMKRKAGSE